MCPALMLDVHSIQKEKLYSFSLDTSFDISVTHRKKLERNMCDSFKQQL